MRRFLLLFVISGLSAQAQVANTIPSVPPVVAPPPVNPSSNLAPDPFSQPLIQYITERYEKALKTSSPDTKMLAHDLEKILAEDPKNYLAMAYLGATDTLLSRDAWPGPSKLTFLKEGGKNLDAAVLADPKNPAVRLVRAIDYFNLPAIFGKRDVARDDFQFLLKQLTGQERLDYDLAIPTKQTIYYYAGMACQQRSDAIAAKSAWMIGEELDPSSEYGKKMDVERRKLEN